MFAFTEYLNRIEWTPRLLTELALTAITLLTVFINWLVRGWRIRGLNQRLARLESAADTISVEEAAEIRQLVAEHPATHFDHAISAMCKRLDAIEASRTDCDKYGLKDELNRFKAVLIGEFGLDNVDQIERLLNAGQFPPQPKPAAPPEPLDAQFMRHFTDNEDLNMDDSDEIKTLMRAAYRAGGGQMTPEVVSMMQQMCGANWSAEDIEAAFTAKADAVAAGD